MNNKNKLLIFLSNNIAFVILIVLLLLAQLFSPGYLSTKHLLGILRLSSFLGIASIAQMLTILTGGIDLSIASNISFAYILAAHYMNGSNENIIIALIIVIFIGLLIGSINAAGICFIKIPPFIMTLGMASVIKGVYMVFTKGTPKGSSAPFMSDLSNGRILGVFLGIVIIWGILSVITIFLLRKTSYGRKIYAIGANSIVANYSGINVTKVRFSVYVLSGIIAAITGFLLIGYTGQSYLGAGESYLNNTIAATVIGGTAIVGGKGSYSGTIAGSIIMIVLVDFLTIIDVPEAGRKMLLGILIIGILIIYQKINKEK